MNKDGTKFILLDFGIANSYSDADHQNIVDILASFIRKDGRKAGRLMIEESNTRSSIAAVNEERFIDKIEELTIAANGTDYLMEKLGTYITFICEAASTHQVLLNPSFVSAALAVKVEEGIALAMDPSLKIADLAIPIIAEAEAKRYWKRIFH